MIVYCCQMRRSGTYPAFQIIADVFMMVECRALCRSPKFFHSRLERPCLHGGHIVHSHAQTRLCLLGSLMRNPNAATYKYTVDYCLLCDNSLGESHILVLWVSANLWPYSVDYFSSFRLFILRSKMNLVFLYIQTLTTHATLPQPHQLLPRPPPPALPA